VSDETQRVKLASPRQDGSASLERCIASRRSTRSFRDQALNEKNLGQLLWAAQGVTAADGGRSVPSAGALYPLKLYVAAQDVTALAGGVYHYGVGRHEIVLEKSGFDREALVAATFGQDWIATAPACFCIAAVFERTAVKYGDRGHAYVFLEAGHAAESLILQAVALGLATTMVGAFSDDDVARFFCLKPNERPLCLLPVGSP
jgi:SagB-type dehydrogenase family enzyme